MRTQTAQPHAHVRFRIAVERRALWAAEDATREFPSLPIEDALELVHLYFERGSPKAEPAARRWLVRYQRQHAESAAAPYFYEGRRAPTATSAMFTLTLSFTRMT